MEFIQIKDLNNESKSFNIRVHVAAKVSERTVSLKDGSRKRVAKYGVMDSTGQAFLTLWGADIDKMRVGQNVQIRNGYVREFKGDLQINVGKYGKWEYIDDPIPGLDRAKWKAVQSKVKNMKFIKIKDIPENWRNFNLEKVKIVEIGNYREVVSRIEALIHKVADVLIGDETGCIKFSLWDDAIQKAKLGTVIRIFNAYATGFNMGLRLKLSRFGGIEILNDVKDEIDVNIENNLSAKTSTYS